MRNYNKVIMILIMVIGFLMGILYYFHIPNDYMVILNDSFNNYISNISYNFNNMFFHLFVIVILLLSSFIVIGYVFNYFYWYFEWFSIGFSISIFLKTLGFKGLILGVIYNIYTKFLFIIFIIYLFYLMRNISILIIKRIKNRNINNDLFYRLVIKSVIIIILIILNDVFIKVTYMHFFKLFQFLL